MVVDRSNWVSLRAIQLMALAAWVATESPRELFESERRPTSRSFLNLSASMERLTTNTPDSSSP